MTSIGILKLRLPPLYWKEARGQKHDVKKGCIRTRRFFWFFISYSIHWQSIFFRQVFKVFLRIAKDIYNPIISFITLWNEPFLILLSEITNDSIIKFLNSKKNNSNIYFMNNFSCYLLLNKQWNNIFTWKMIALTIF